MKEALNFRIRGGKKLSGSVTVNTAKNSAVALLCASLLNRGTTVLKRMPRIEEVSRIIEVLQSIGADVVWTGEHEVTVRAPGKPDLQHINRDAAMQTRSIIMLIGPLVHALRNFSIPQAGGCKLGSRTVRPHFYALEKLGVKIKTREASYDIALGSPKPAHIVLYESGDTVTENVLMAAAGIPGTTTVKLASANYQVQDLCRFLEKLGVIVRGVGTTTLEIEGKPDIEKNVSFSLSEDPIEAMLFLSIAATTNSAFTVKGAPLEFLELELLKLEKMGMKYKVGKPYRSENGFTELVDIRTLPSKLKALEEKIYARPFPGLNIDNLPFFVPIATQAAGQTLIHDWVFENRAIYYTELTKLGANIVLADPHRVIVTGPTPLKATEVICPPALRPAAIILIGMLAAHGESILRNVYSINRGYEDLASRLRTLGADIETIEG